MSFIIVFFPLECRHFPSSWELLGFPLYHWFSVTWVWCVWVWFCFCLYCLGSREILESMGSYNFIKSCRFLATILTFLFLKTPDICLLNNWYYWMIHCVSIYFLVFNLSSKKYLLIYFWLCWAFAAAQAFLRLLWSGAPL